MPGATATRTDPGLPTQVRLGFDGPTNKLMKIMQDVRARALFWFVIVLIYEGIEMPVRRRSLRARVYDGGGRRHRRRRR